MQWTELLVGAYERIFGLRDELVETGGGAYLMEIEGFYTRNRGALGQVVTDA